MKALNDHLLEMSANMKTQDGRMTAEPIYVVQERKRIYGIDEEWTDDIVWLFDGEEVNEQVFGEEFEKVKEYYDYHLHLRDYPDWARTGYVDIWENHQPFFTEKGAQSYIDANRHRLTDPRIYVDSAYRNQEWIDIRRMLSALDMVRDETVSK